MEPYPSAGNQPNEEPLSSARRFNRQVEAVVGLFNKLDQDISAFQGRTGLQCLADCGHCCESPHVEVSALEMFPLAGELLKRHEADVWADRVQSAEGQGRCVFYQPDPLREGQGRCGQYPLRPLICRLFGFSAVRGKDGQPALVTCRRIKAQYPAQCQKAAQWIEQGGAPPSMNDYVRSLLSIDPYWGMTQYSINQALGLALEHTALLMRYDKGM